MKKLIILLIIIYLPVIIIGQTSVKTNFVIEKTAPTLHLKGSNGIINFNSGDVTLTNTSNALTIVGGVLALPANGLLINSINHLYGLTDTITDLYYTKTIINTYLAGKQDTGVISMTYPASGIALSTGSAWESSITNNSANWNTAYTDRLKWDGGNLDLVASTGRTSLGGTTVGQAFFTLTNPGAITFPRINDNNSVSALSAADFKSALSLTSSDVGLGNVTNKLQVEVEDSTGISLGNYTPRLQVANMINDSLDARIGDGVDIGDIAVLKADSTGISQGNYMPRVSTAGLVNDTIVARLAAASVGLVVQDYEGGSTGNNYYMTPEQVRSEIVAGGGGLNGQILKFIVGTTTGAPATTDSTLIHTEFGGKHIDLYRDGALAYYNGSIAANLNEGFRLNTNTITVNPLWQDKEQVEIRILDPIAWSNLSFEGQESTLLDSLLLYYKLDEASGSVADDANDVQNATLYSGTGRVISKSGLGNAVHIATSSDYIRSSYNALSNIDTTFSISMWFYLDSLPSVVGQSYLFYAHLDASPWYANAIALEDVDRIRFTVRNDAGTGYNVYSSGTLSDSTWYHLVVTCRGNGNTSQIYLNGTDVSSSAGTFSGGIYNTNNYLYIGSGSSGLYHCPKIIDEVGLWHRVLTSGEITDLYNSGVGKQHPF